jgi:hypothetical protein
MRRSVYLLLGCGIILALAGQLPLGTANAQTLAQVLTAIQKRNTLLQDRGNVAIDLLNSASATRKDVQPILWPGLPSEPTDGEVDGLSVDSKLNLLRLAWMEMGRLELKFKESRNLASGVGRIDDVSYDGVAPRIDVTTFRQVVSILAHRLAALHMMEWPLSWTYIPHGVEYGKSDGSGSLPSPPITFTSTPYSFSDTSTTLDVSFRGGVGFSGGATNTTRAPDGSTGWNGNTTWWAGPITAEASDTYGGDVKIFTDFHYDVNHLSGLAGPSGFVGDGTDATLYHPSNQLAFDENISEATKGASFTMPGIFGAAPTGISISGSWEYLYDKDGKTLGASFLRSFPFQSDSDLWKSIFVSFDNTSLVEGNGANHLDYYWNEYWGELELWNATSSPTDYPTEGANWGLRCWDDGFGGALDFESLYAADFGQEFDFPVQPVPEAPPPLRLVTDFANGRMEVKLGETPANECELAWQFPERISTSKWYVDDYFGAISARRVLEARGSGDWEAVYSGKPEDREDELPWSGIYTNASKRWPTFGSYMREWWHPVLKQLVCPTYGANITQLDRFTYKIEFCRRDQISKDRDPTTGEYTFNGTPVETFTVQNPDKDDATAGKLEIKTAKGATYDLTLTQQYDDNGRATQSEWVFKGVQGNVQFLSKDVIVTPSAITYTVDVASQNVTYTMSGHKKVVDNTTIDGVAQPTVTTTYWQWPHGDSLTRIRPDDGYAYVSWDGAGWGGDTSWNGYYTHGNILYGKGEPYALLNLEGDGPPTDQQWIDQVVETGADGTRTTTYSYNKEDQETYPGSGIHFNGIDHLTGITQSGGSNPYTANYDDAGQLTSYSDTWGSETVSYSGNTVTTTQKINGQPVRTLVTTYSGDLSQATTTAQ